MCPNGRAPSPAPAEDCISKATFFRHALDARGLRILIASTPAGTAIQIIDTSGNLASLEDTQRREPLAPSLPLNPAPFFTLAKLLWKFEKVKGGRLVA
jgi:hypothetical protein